MYWLRFCFEMTAGTVVSGVLAAAFLLADEKNIAGLEKFTRNRVIGLIIAFPALFACVPHAQIVAPGILQEPLLLYALAVTIPILCYFYIDYYTARAIGGAVIILAYDLIHYAYDEKFAAAGILTVAAWIFGFAGIWMSGKPYALRDWFRLAAAKRGFARSAAAVSLFYGLCFLFALICGIGKIL